MLMSEKKNVLFICTHNSARSQMAEGYLRARYGNRYVTSSGGTQVMRVHPVAIEVMKDIGIDISSQRSKRIDEFYHKPIDIVVTVCDSAKAVCPFFPGNTKISTIVSRIHRDLQGQTRKSFQDSGRSGIIS
jgi:arsenate reductase